MRAGSREQGFTYVIVLAALAIFGIGLAAVGESWSSAARRERENELVQVGAVYVQAIGSYYQRSPGTLKRFPMRLEELVVTKGGGWGLVRAPDGGIAGIYSESRQQPLRKTVRLPDGGRLAGERYEEWKFIYVPPVAR
jgi:type II secretory pathway pseudopilin PulG